MDRPSPASERGPNALLTSANRIVVPTGGVRATHATLAIAIAATKAIARIVRPRSTLAAMSSTRHMAAEARSALVSVMVRDGSIPRVDRQRAGHQRRIARLSSDRSVDQRRHDRTAVDFERSTRLRSIRTSPWPGVRMRGKRFRVACVPVPPCRAAERCLARRATRGRAW
jgi:hypothetical protein